MQMKEIGGYQDFEQYHGPMLHDDGIKLNCGRNCLAYLIEAKDIRKIRLPYFLCDSVINLCRKYEIEILFYNVGIDFRPIDIDFQTSDEWIYLVNYYGQLTPDDIRTYKEQYNNVIIDNAQAYFDEPITGVDTLYTCRKFFGVADGAILFTDVKLNRQLELDESCQHMMFLLGRYERTASEYHPMMVENNRRFINEPIKGMSRLSENILHSIDYQEVKRIRTENYLYLSGHLSTMNRLSICDVEGAFSYPLLPENSWNLRQKLINNKVYVPTLWPNVIEQTEETTVDHILARDILPIPCDQRYGIKEMEYIVELIK